MLLLNYRIPPLDFQGWHNLIREQEYQLENPPKELHLVMDITRLNKGDIDWIKYHCPRIIPEIKILVKNHNEKILEYRKTLNKALPKENIKLMKKAPRIKED